MIACAGKSDFIRRVEISERLSPCFEGHAFGEAGPYERLRGVVHCELDPGHRLNAGIVNLKRAPRNARGNGWLFYESLNRGGKRSIDSIK